VHSHLTHLYALVKLAHNHGLDRVFIHCFMDGRDVPPQSGQGFIEALEKELAESVAGASRPSWAATMPWIATTGMSAYSAHTPPWYMAKACK
jgi:hypothetical protein